MRAGAAAASQLTTADTGQSYGNHSDISPAFSARRAAPPGWRRAPVHFGPDEARGPISELLRQKSLSEREKSRRPGKLEDAELRLRLFAIPALQGSPRSHRSRLGRIWGGGQKAALPKLAPAPPTRDRGISCEQNTENVSFNNARIKAATNVAATKSFKLSCHERSCNQKLQTQLPQT